MELYGISENENDYERQEEDAREPPVNRSD